MKNVIIIGLIAGVIGGVAATTATRYMTPSDAAPSAAPKTVNALQPETEADSDLLGQVASLRRENDELGMRLATLERRSKMASREAVDVGGDIDLAELQQQVAALAAALQNPQSGQSAGLRNMVAGALKEVQDEESEQRQIERDQRDVDRIVESMGKYSEQLGLNAVQRESMQGVLIDSGKKRNDLMATMRDGNMPRGDIRSAFSDMRDETNDSLKGILSPQQFDDYGEMSNNSGRFFGGGRGAGGSTSSTGKQGGGKGGGRGGRGGL